MKRKTQIAAALLEVLALVLAHLQSLAGVRTDEAKYLLSIPYPHPPFLRTIMSMTDALPFQEWLWRAIFASLLIQSMWLVLAMTKKLGHAERFAVAGSWLFSTALILQAGTVMMAPITALQGLVFLWLYLDEDTTLEAIEEGPVKNFFHRISRYPVAFIRLVSGKNNVEREEWKTFWIAALWFASLFTAYHIVLFMPVVVALFLKSNVSPAKKFVYFFGPLLAAVLYTVGNPLIMGSFVIQGTKDATETIGAKVSIVLWLWIYGGSLLGSIGGTIGILRSKSWPLILSFLLVFGAIFAAHQPYYAILFTPLFIAGLIHYFARSPLKYFPYTTLYVCATAIFVGILPPWFAAVPRTRQIITAIEARHKQGPILIVGTFGHEWQYESQNPIRRFNKALLPQAQAVVCNDSCNDVILEGFQLLPKTLDVWVRK